jgi:hypothetical protein
VKLRKLVGGCLSRVYKSPPLTPVVMQKNRSTLALNEQFFQKYVRSDVLTAFSLNCVKQSGLLIGAKCRSALLLPS